MRDLRHDLEWALSKNEFPVVLVHALERAIKAEEKLEEVLDVLMDEVAQSCYVPQEDIYDSKALSSYAEALELLCEMGRLEYIEGNGRRVIARRPKGAR